MSEHIKHIFEEGELNREAVVRKFRTTAADGKNYNVEHYNLDMIISLGYRIKSSIATTFRIWATQRLREYLIKGFTIANDRLKNLGGGNYFVFQNRAEQAAFCRTRANSCRNHLFQGGFR